AKKVADRRREVLAESEAVAAEYLAELAGTQGQGAYIGSAGNYPLLRGVQGNLYKAFLLAGWTLSSRDGTIGLWHQPGILDDPKGGRFRAEFLSRVVLFLGFRNELMLFK